MEKIESITPEEKKLIGTYEGIDGNGVSTKYVLLQNGVVEWYVNGKIIEEGIAWEKNQDGALHILPEGGATAIYRINKDGSLTGIGLIKPNGKPFDWPKEKQIGLIQKSNLLRRSQKKKLHLRVMTKTALPQSQLKS